MPLVYSTNVSLSVKFQDFDALSDSGLVVHHDSLHAMRGAGSFDSAEVGLELTRERVEISANVQALFIVRA